MLRRPLVAIAAVLHTFGHGACMMNVLRSMSCIGRSNIPNPVENVATALGLRHSEPFKQKLTRRMGHAASTLTLPMACTYIVQNPRTFVKSAIISSVGRASAPLKELYDSEEEDDNYAEVPLKSMDNLLHMYFSTENKAHALTLLSAVLHELSGGHNERGVYNACRGLGFKTDECHAYATETKKLEFMSNDVRHTLTMSMAVAALAVSEHGTTSGLGRVIKMDTGHDVFFESIWMHAASLSISDRKEHAQGLWQHIQHSVNSVQYNLSRPEIFALIAQGVWHVTNEADVPLNSSAWLAWQSLVYRCGNGLYDISAKLLQANDGATCDWSHELRHDFMNVVGSIASPLVVDYSYFRRLYSHITDLMAFQTYKKSDENHTSKQSGDELGSSSLNLTVSRAVELAIYRTQSILPTSPTLLYIGYREMLLKYWRTYTGVLPVNATMDIFDFLENLLGSKSTSNEIRLVVNAYKFSRESDRITFEDASTIHLLYMALAWSGDLPWRELKTRLDAIGMNLSEEIVRILENLFSTPDFVDTRSQRLIQFICKT